MSLLDALLGRTRPARSRDEQLIALSSAAVSLSAELGLQASGQAAIVIRPLDSQAYRDADADLSRLLELAGRETGATVTRQADPYGYAWVVIADPDLADLVANAYQVSIELRDAGFGDAVLAAAFGFRDAAGRPAFLLYSFKRAAFYPFVPGPGDGERDNARELQLASAVGREIPVEPDQARWYPMWAMPLDGAPGASGHPAQPHAERQRGDTPSTSSGHQPQVSDSSADNQAHPEQRHNGGCC